MDYYNYGDPKPGSVFEVAARANDVEYNRSCCGARTSAASERPQSNAFALGTIVLSAFAFLHFVI